MLPAAAVIWNFMIFCVKHNYDSSKVKPQECISLNKFRFILFLFALINYLT